MKLYKLITFIILSCISFVKCDINKSDIENDQSFIRIFHDNNLNNDYHPLDVAELNDGFLILSTKILVTDSNSYSYTHHLPYIIKTDIEGKVEWTFEGEHPYISPIPNILEVKGKYYFFTSHETSLEPTLFEIDLDSENISLIAQGIFGNSLFALKAIVDSEENIILLTNKKTGVKYSEVYKINGISDVILSEKIATMFNRAQAGEERINPLILEHLSHKDKRYPFMIKEYKKNNKLEAYLVNCFNNELLSLNYVDPNNSTHSDWIRGTFTGTDPSASIVYLDSYHQLNDSIVAIVKNDNDRISIKSDLLLNENISYDIDELTETTTFIELDGNTLIPSKIFTSGDKDYLIYAIATKGEQVALFIYNMEDFALHNIYYVGSTNDISPVTIKQTSDDKLLLLCRTLVTNKYSRIALYKIPFKEIGI